MRKTRSMKDRHSTTAIVNVSKKPASKKQGTLAQDEDSGRNKSSINREITFNSHHSDIFDNLHRMQKEGTYCDIKLKAKTGYVLAHRLVLIAVSPFFYEQLRFNEGVGESSQSLELKHIPLKVLRDIVSFIYSGKIKVLSKNVNQFAESCQSIGLKTLYDKLAFEDDLEPKEILNAPKNKKRKKEDKSTSGHVSEEVFSKTPSKTKSKKQDNEDCKVGSVESGHVSERALNASKSQKQENEDSSIECVEFKTDSSGHVPGNNCDIEVTRGKRRTSSQRNTILNNSCKSSTSSSDVSLFTDSKHNSIIHDYESYNSQNRNKEKSIDEMKTCNDEIDVCELSTSDVEDFGNKDDATTGPNTCIDNHIKLHKTNAEFPENPINVGAIQYQEAVKSEDSPDDIKPNENLIKSTKKTAVHVQRRNNNAANLFCIKCREVFSNQSDKLAHKKTCKRQRPRRRCILCKISFATTEEYTHHRNTDVNCLQIRKEKHTKRLQRKAQLRSRFCCRVCPRKFRRVADHVDHEFTAHDLPYDKEKWPDKSCEWCAYTTMNPWRLHHHKTYDCSQGKKYICDICGNNYKNVKTLKCHKEMMHTDTVPMLPCDQCGKSLKGPKGLEYHIQIMHKGENPHKRHMCHMCSMKYSSSSDLTFHLHRIHNQPLPEGFIVYTCQECDYMINHKRVYEKHLLLHQDKRDFTCDKCEKSFKTRGSLQTHLKSHIGKKMPCPYENCKYEALKKCHLKTHIENQHTKKGVKNEKCHVCSYSTFFKGNLIKHLRTVHQLEVVTRYSVQMKAKYKHLKTGDIVGEAVPSRNGKKQINCDKPTDSKDYVKQENLHMSNPNEFHRQTVPMSNYQELMGRSQPVELQYTTTPFTSVISKNPPIASYQTYTSYYAPGTVGHLTNIPDQSFSSRIHPTHTIAAGYQREVIGYENNTGTGKSAAGVTYHGLFQEQSLAEDVSHGTKMLTYTQI